MITPKRQRENSGLPRKMLATDKHLLRQDSETILGQRRDLDRVFLAFVQDMNNHVDPQNSKGQKLKGVRHLCFGSGLW